MSRIRGKKPVNWSAVDWTKEDWQLGFSLDVSRAHVCGMRQKYAPHTAPKQLAKKENGNG